LEVVLAEGRRIQPAGGTCSLRLSHGS
jgi:hypothetical protein